MWRYGVGIVRGRPLSMFLMLIINIVTFYAYGTSRARHQCISGAAFKPQKPEMPDDNNGNRKVLYNKSYNYLSPCIFHVTVKAEVYMAP